MRALKFIGIAVVVVLVLALGAVGALALKPPKSRAASAEKIQATPAMVERGRYLAELSGCVDCHSQRDWGRYSGPVVPGSVGSGGVCMGEAEGLPGTVCMPNLTSDPKTGLGAWTDGEVMRAIREGVSRDGHALFAMMPYPDFASMSDDDVRAVVAYLRTLPAVEKAVPRSRLVFPVSLLVKLGPQPLEGPVAAPPRTDKVAYGHYLAVLACKSCHTPIDKGQPIPGMEFAGGMDFKGPFGHAVSANLTSDSDTGLGGLTREQFIGRFKAFATMDASAPAPAGRGTPMPWRMLASLPEEDLGAIYDYLHTLKPVNHPINRFPGN